MKNSAAFRSHRLLCTVLAIVIAFGSLICPIAQAESTADYYANAVLFWTNVERQRHGLPEFKTSDTLMSIASKRSGELTTYYSHDRPDRSGFYTALDQGGITSTTGYKSAAENIARGDSTPYAVVRGWMGSEAHRNTILNSKYDYMGCGYSYIGSGSYYHYWEQLFVKSRSTLPGTHGVFYVAPTAFSLSLKGSSLKLSVGEELTLSPAIVPAYATEAVKCVSSDTRIVRVSGETAADITVKGIRDGTATLTFTCGNLPAQEIRVTVGTGVYDASFVDVPKTKFFYNAVLWATDNGITSGKDDSHFDPYGVCTRAQSVAFLWRAAGKPEPTQTVNPYKDVSTSAYYYKAILWAAENGIVNGYLNPSLTNKEMKELCTKAPNICMDVVGKRVHSIWTSEGLANYCKDSKGSGLGYRQYINVLDSLIVWEHRSLGFEKYNRIPRNRTMAYVNFTYYMFQGGFGVSFHRNQEQRVLNCKTLIYNDNDAIWGLSHEWGHQHQMHPYFCWAGLGEVSNNVQSYYNITHMGYRTSDKFQSWPDARKHFYETTATPVKQDAVEHGMAYRGQAYKYRTEIRNAKLREVAAAQTGADTTATAYDANPRRALHINEMDVCEALTPFIMLNNYFTQNRPDGKTDTKYCDFSADWYESLRQNDDENGSQIEKKGEADKYELIASAQNGNKNNKLAALKKRFPESCWVKNNYVDASSQSSENSVPFILNWIRKTSRLSGYNLWPYFERFGFLRTIALRIGDYGNAWYVMNDEIYDEFKADMDALVASGELKAMSDAMVKAIFYCPDDWQPVPNIAND